MLFLHLHHEPHIDFRVEGVVVAEILPCVELDFKDQTFALSSRFLRNRDVFVKIGLIVLPRGDTSISVRKARPGETLLRSRELALNTLRRLASDSIQDVTGNERSFAHACCCTPYAATALEMGREREKVEISCKR